MNIVRKEENGIITLELNGELTALTAEKLSSEVKTAAAESTHLVFDFAGLEYIASAGLRVLLEAKKLMDSKDGKFTVRNVSGEIMHILDITGFSDMLDFG